jgi:hypothetical protein
MPIQKARAHDSFWPELGAQTRKRAVRGVEIVRRLSPERLLRCHHRRWEQLQLQLLDASTELQRLEPQAHEIEE